MSFLKKIFGKGGEEPVGIPMDIPADSPAFDGDPIRAFDKFGREITITRKDWFESVLKGNIENAWNDPEELAALVHSAFSDGFIAAMEAPAQRLREIDTIPDRGYSFLGVYYLQTDQPAKAQTVLEEYLDRFGESGVILTNLAKAHSAQGREEESLETLWHALELDPNQDNGMSWYEVIFREKEGKEAGNAALRRVAEIPGSWRAQIWLAREALAENDLESAIPLYQQALAAAGTPPPSDLLMQMSGDLGNAGYLGEILALVSPHFDPVEHGIQVGKNLIKANLDLGQFEAANAVIRDLQLQQRPDWQETIGFWEAELSKASCETQNVGGRELPGISLLWLEGPLSLKPEVPTAKLFPDKCEDATRICFLGCTADTSSMGSETVHQPSDNPGRFSRGLPLLVAEHVYHSTEATTTTLIPWIAGDHPSFVLSGKMWKDEDAAAHSRSGESPNDYVVVSHLQARGENWKLFLRFVRTIDGKCLRESEYALAEFAFHDIAEQVFRDLDRFLSEEVEAGRLSLGTLALPAGDELDHYLFRLEQSLAVRCYAMESSESVGLSNPSEIINGMIQTCIDNPQNVSCRLLLLRTLAALKKIDPELTASFREKVEALSEDHPLSGEADGLVSEELGKVLEV